jgi:hypothetical protein
LLVSKGTVYKLNAFFGRATAVHYRALQRAIRYKLFAPQRPVQKGFTLLSRAGLGIFTTM